jgi:hypothetical protein
MSAPMIRYSFRSPEAPMQFFQGFDGVGRGRPFGFERRRGQTGMIGKRRLQHGHPVDERSQFTLFVRRAGRGDKKNDIQTISLTNRAGHREMPHVHRVEGAAQDADPLLFLPVLHLNYDRTSPAP